MSEASDSSRKIAPPQPKPPKVFSQALLFSNTQLLKVADPCIILIAPPSLAKDPSPPFLKVMSLKVMCAFASLILKNQYLCPWPSKITVSPEL